MSEIITKSDLETTLLPVQEALIDLINSTKEYRRNADRDTREMKKDTQQLKKEFVVFKDEMLRPLWKPQFTKSQRFNKFYSLDNQ